MACRRDEAVQEVEVEEIEEIEIQKGSYRGDEKDAKDVERLRRDLMKSIPRNWENVVKIYKQDRRAHKVMVGESGNTSLHMAVVNGREDIVDELVKAINEMNEDPLDVLSIKCGDWESTPLHLAASFGSIRMCKYIIGHDKQHKELLANRNTFLATPMYIAVYHAKKDTFLWLYEMCDSSAQAYAYCHAHRGITVLHVAIENGYWDLAFQIIHRLEDLMDCVNEYGNSPLHMLARTPSAFRSGINLSFFQNIIYSCIHAEELILDTTIQEKKSMESLVYPKNYETCINFFQVIWKMIKLLANGEKGIQKSNRHLDAENPEEGQGHHGRQGFPSTYRRCLNFLGLILSKFVDSSIEMGSSQIITLKGIKESHVWSVQIMNILLEHAVKFEFEYEMNHQKNKTTTEFHPETSEAAECYSEYGVFRRGKAFQTPILTAAMNGIIEMVEKILQVFPMTIHDRDSTLKNIVLVAVKYRQSHVYDFLLKRGDVDKDFVFRERDNEENTALHMVAELQNLVYIPISILQLQWEIKWYEYVLSTLPPDFYVREDSYRRSAPLIFGNTHYLLLEKSKEWLNKACNSCSFIAALISTVAFASLATVPGGVNQESGKPIFQNHLAFRFFAISSLVALCSSFISLLIFLSILMSKYHYEDFSDNLPRNLILGLTSLFTSMAAMLLCFCSGHYLMLDDHLKYTALPVYAFTFLAVTYFSLKQFPSFLVLLRATFKKVPQRPLEL